jgi:Bacterial SH3 domain
VPPGLGPRRRPGSRLLNLLVAVTVVLVGLAGCHPLNGHSSSTTTAPPTTVKPHPTTVPGGGSTGDRTVLSPIGINVHAQPSKAAKILGAADQGTVLHVLGYTTAAEGWYKVRGETVTGWVIASPSLTAPGVFSVYSSSVFGTLYPATWSYRASAGTVVFRSPASSVVFEGRPAAKVAQFRAGSAGYGRTGTTQVVVCGVTSSLDTYTYAGPTPTTTKGRAAPAPYLIQIRLTLDAKHALGIDASMTSTTQMTAVDDFVNSMTFPFPMCVGK